MGFIWPAPSERAGSPLDRVPLLLNEVVNDLPVDLIECPDLLEIGQMWLDLPRREGRRLPLWADFKPTMIARYLAKMSILHVGDWRAGEIEFTLYGDHLTKTIGNGRPLNLAKLRTDPIRCENYTDIVTRAGRAVEREAPQYARKTLAWDGLGDVEYEVLMLPFQPDENGMSRVMQPLSSQPRPD